jgi:ribosomal-protein-alanine N-acetyltransferase
MSQTLATVTLLVRDYDEAIAFFTNALCFNLIEDTSLGDGKRWVRVAPRGSIGASLLLAEASTPEQEKQIGNQTGGRVFLFLHTDDFWRNYHCMKSNGVKFREEPREESYGTVAVFEDLYGNLWDLLEPSGKHFILETERLSLRKITVNDAEFIFQLLNEPSFIRNIGDKGVRTTDDAVQYLLKGPIDSYKRRGFGLWMVELKESKVPIGMCGLLKRDTLPDVDIGYAFLPPFWSNGYAYESAAAVKNYGTNALRLKHLLAVVNHDNVRSIKVLEKLGLQFERMIRLTESEPEIKLYSISSGK